MTSRRSLIQRLEDAQETRAQLVGTRASEFSGETRAQRTQAKERAIRAIDGRIRDLKRLLKHENDVAGVQS